MKDYISLSDFPPQTRDGLKKWAEDLDMSEMLTGSLEHWAWIFFCLQEWSRGPGLLTAMELWKRRGDLHARIKHLVDVIETGETDKAGGLQSVIQQTREAEAEMKRVEDAITFPCELATTIRRLEQLLTDAAREAVLPKPPVP